MIRIPQFKEPSAVAASQDLKRVWNSHAANIYRSAVWYLQSEAARLPHPIALNQSGYYDRFLRFLPEPIIAEKKRVFGVHLVKPLAIVHELITDMRKRGEFECLRRIGYQPELMSHILPVYGVHAAHQVRHGIVIETTRGLDELLNHTDIGLDINEAMFEVPLPNSYIHFAQPLPVESSRTVSVVGAYIFFNRMKDLKIGPGLDELEPGVAKRYKIDEGDDIKNIDIYFVYHDEDGPYVRYGMVGMENFTLKVGDTTPIIIKMNDSLNNGVEGSLAHDISKVGFIHILKVLFYMACRDARVINRIDLTMAKGKLDHLGNKKKAKAERKLSNLYDCIVVGPEKSLSDFISASGDRTVIPHWRRGHFRAQPYGENRSLRRLTFIQPLIVNKSLLGISAEPKAKDYRVKGTE